MRKDMNPLVQHSPFGGTLVEEQVAGATSGNLNPENNVDTGRGRDRSMFVYVPKSGCPHPKQTKVLMVLRDGATLESAQALLDGLGIVALAEEGHFVVVFPNPLEEGWNYALDAAREDDAAFIVRCFAALPGSKGGVAGFNGMICHVATSPATSAMVASLALTRPLDSAAIMVGSFPEGYQLPDAPRAQQVAWVYDFNRQLEQWVCESDDATVPSIPTRGVSHVYNADNPAVGLFGSEDGLTADTMRLAWDLMFEDVRRWRNDTYGIYEPRPDFDALGFVAHVKDTGLGLADGLPRTWYEYVPARLRNATDPVPLVFYLHGINCCGLYGAEQSGWIKIAERDGVAVVFPDATIEDRWNGWDDRRLPSDMDFVMALIEHMDQVVPVDRRRIYVSGFSMGSMMSSALASAHPEVFAGAIALNGPHQSYLTTLDQSAPMLLAFKRTSVLRDLALSDEETSPLRAVADAKKDAFAYRMPFVQFAGLCDGMGLPSGRTWPLTEADESLWKGTLRYWLAYNDCGELAFDATTPSGFASDTLEQEGDRFNVQGWRSADEGAPVLYRFVTVERLEHAVDPRALELGWAYVRDFAREADGSLTCTNASVRPELA